MKLKLCQVDTRDEGASQQVERMTAEGWKITSKTVYLINMEKFEEPRKRKKKDGLNDLQRAQLQDCLKAGMTVKVGQVSDSLKKDCLDTPLFQAIAEQQQTKLF